MKGYIQQKDIYKYRIQLAQKKSHLHVAKNFYQKAMDLIEQFKQKILIAEEQLNVIKNKLISCEDNETKHKLELQKAQFELLIISSPEKLDFIMQQLNELAENIQQLEANISNLIEQARKITNSVKPDTLD